MLWWWLRGVLLRSNIIAQCIDYRHETIYCCSFSHRIARSFVQISDFPWKFIVSSLQQYMNSKIPCSLSILTIFRTLIPFQNCYKIEMTYFIYNWKFRVVCMLMSERRRWRRLDCTMWPACASDRLHVLVIWASGRSLYILTKLLLLGSCYK